MHQAWIECLAPEDAQFEGLFLSGAGAGLVEYARGRAVLHGSSVAFGEVGAVFVGPSARGKSSLAAWLCSRSWRFVSDAMTVVEPRTRALVQQPHRFRLRDDAVKALGSEPGDLPIDDQLTGKRRIDVGVSQCIQSSLRLERAFVIEPGTAVRLEELEKSSAVMALVGNSYLAGRMGKVESGLPLLRAASLVDSGLRVQILSYPRTWTALEDVRLVLEKALLSV